MNKKEAKELDTILDMFTYKVWVKEVNEEQMQACYTLADRGMIEILSHESRKIRLTDKGAYFRAKGGFLEEWKKENHVRQTRIWAIIAAIAAIAGVIVSTIQLMIQWHMS